LRRVTGVVHPDRYQRCYQGGQVQADSLATLGRARDFALENKSLAIAGITFSIVVFRMLATANFDSTVAIALVTHSSTSTVLLGLAVTVFGVIVAALPALLILSALGLGEGGWRAKLLVFPALLVASVLAPAYALLISVGVSSFVALVALFIRFRLGGKTTPPGEQGPTSPLSLAAVSLLVLALVASSPPWYATEIVQTTSHGTFSGYVLGFEDNWTTILTEQDRTLLIIPASEITFRQVCRTDALRTLTVWQLGATTMPGCLRP
jgi:hypothetical protein